MGGGLSIEKKRCQKASLLNQKKLNLLSLARGFHWAELRQIRRGDGQVACQPELLNCDTASASHHPPSTIAIDRDVCLAIAIIVGRCGNVRREPEVNRGEAVM